MHVSISIEPERFRSHRGGADVERGIGIRRYDLGQCHDAGLPGGLSAGLQKRRLGATLLRRGDRWPRDGEG